MEAVVWEESECGLGWLAGLIVVSFGLYMVLFQKTLVCECSEKRSISSESRVHSLL